MVRHLSPLSSPLHVSVGDKIPLIPGFRTSAAFLSSLSANLRIPEDDLWPTPVSTPAFRNSDTLLLPLPPPSPLAAMSIQHDAVSAPAPPLLEPLPQLTSYRADTQQDRIAGLKLIADSIAQQRQAASSAVIYHPAVLGSYGLALAAVARVFYRDLGDLPVLMTTILGLTMAALLAVRWATAGYIALAELIGWDWLADDAILVTRWGDEIIGALVLGWAAPESTPGAAAAGTNNRKMRKRNDRKRYGLVRGWCVTVRYRGKGVGKALLEDAVQEVVKQGGEGIEFAEEHATHNRLLPSFFNSAMDKGEQRAVNTLHEIASTKGNFGRRRSRRSDSIS